MSNRWTNLVFFSVILITLISRISMLPLWLWWLELASHFQVQYFVLTLVLALIACKLHLQGRGDAKHPFWRQSLAWGGDRRKIRLLGLLFCVALQFSSLAIWYLPAPQLRSAISEATALKLRILASNVHPENTNYSALLNLIAQEQPDIAVVMEVNQTWLTELDGLRAKLPYRYEDLQGSNWGNAVYSRFPLENVQFPVPNFVISGLARLGEEQLGDQSREQGRARSEAALVHLVVTHPRPPIRPSLAQAQRSIFRAIQTDIQAVRVSEASHVNHGRSPMRHPHPNLSTIVVGDLNTTPWSPTYQAFVRGAQLRNSSQGFGLWPSWSPQSYGSWLRAMVAPLLWIPIDHCLVSKMLTVKQFRLGPDIGSDHLPLIVEVAVLEG